MSHKHDHEKAPLLPHTPQYPTPTSRALVVMAACFLSALLQLALAPFWASSHADHSTTQVLRPPTSPGVFWSICPDSSDFICSYLSVPMDYTNPQANETVSLALRMYPASAPLSDQLGYLFLNPGGPGGSSHEFVANHGAEFSAIVEGRYHIISWDPRGVNLTSPPLSCFATEGEGTRFARDLEQLGLPFDARGSTAADGTKEGERLEKEWLRKVDAFAEATNRACQESGNQKMLRASSTSFVVRDMKRILEALGEPNLKYWGFSYGTVLGATLAAMFPQLVDRVILDGAVDMEFYYNSFLDWARVAMNDTQKTFDGFFSLCALAGPDGCALSRGIEIPAKDIKNRYDAILEGLRERPMPVGSSKVGAGVLTASQVQYFMYEAMFNPKDWANVARALAKLERGNGSLAYELANESNNQLALIDPRNNVFNRAMETSEDVAGAAILCTDADISPLAAHSFDAFYTFLKEMMEISPFGDIWMTTMAQCRHWKPRAIETYRGPTSARGGLRKTAHPILVLSNTYDPVTPLVSARKLADAFAPSSSLLVQDGYGHCTLSHPSSCTAKHVRKYLLEGKLPSDGTMCKVDKGWLFPSLSLEREMQDDEWMAAGQDEVWRRLATGWRAPKLGRKKK